MSRSRCCRPRWYADPSNSTATSYGDDRTRLHGIVDDMLRRDRQRLRVLLTTPRRSIAASKVRRAAP